MFDQIESPRLIIRRYRLEDKDELFDALSREDTVQFEPYPPFTYDQMDAEMGERVKNDQFFAVEEKANHRLIGTVFFAPRMCESFELGYVFHPLHWGKGYATEACSAVVDYAFQHGIHRVFAECDPQNTASWKLLERLKFLREAHLIQNVYFKKDDQGNPIWKDTFIYAKRSGK